ncbi:MAG: class I SAM-dependent rRNA methyltransferase [Wenzhouxiangella sp.]|nr:MAG: class I SAM-dependent rRNA methyltransferase [Wenzhouxiangella sp.]
MTRTDLLILKKGEDKRLRAGHLWVFSNEVDVKRSPLVDLEPGQVADVVDAGGRAVGTALVNPHSLICARLISRRPGVVPDATWFAHRIRAALGLRQRLFPAPFYRLVFGESDALPGLVVDRYDSVLVAQANTAGMDRLRPVIEEALGRVLEPTGMIWRNDAAVRELEGLPRVIESGPGRVPDHLSVREGDLHFEVDLMTAQKTGWYFDQQANRQRVWPLLAGLDRVADLYAYHGAWGLGAAARGTAEVVCVDSSQPAVNAIRSHAAANGLDQQVRAVQTDAEAWLDEQLAAGTRFDAIIVDPPAFAQRARDVKPALSAYRRINQKALRLVRSGGVLVSCSCSAHILEDRFADLLRQASRHVDRDLQILMRLEQGPDHPVCPAIPMTRYLKGLVVRVHASF